jgi:hypothetical protein
MGPAGLSSTLPPGPPRGAGFLSAYPQQLTCADGEIIKVFSYLIKQQQNERERDVQLDGIAGSKQHSGSMSASIGHVWGFATAPLGEVVRRCLGLAIFGPNSICWARIPRFE